ncbi:hypothetical protein EDB82DRAFT_466623 [Fusarium venenatum]|nr:hypothetical protein EDB82DRAFT_466623 [Fusarium venenatum]
MPFRKRWRKLLPSSEPSEVSDGGSPSVSQVPPQDAQQGPSTATGGIILSPGNTTVQSQVWNDAYASLKAEELRTVEAYERILSGQLTSGVEATSVEGYPDNFLGTAEDRRTKMAKLIEDGKSRTERVAKAKENINDVVQPFNQLRSTISLVVKADPTASTAWVGIAAVLGIFASPLTEPGANRDGMKYILERAEWYWNLSALILDADKIDESLKSLQGSLKKSIVKLYKKLLLYQMQSVCLYSCSEVATILRDFVKLDDWEGKIKSIEKEALRVEQSIRQLRDEDETSQLRNLNMRLQDGFQALATVIQDSGSQQRELREEEKDRQFLSQLHDTDPAAGKKAIETLKGGIVRKAHDLVFEQSNFETLQQNSSPGIMWTTGNAGSGKTMFLCGIVDRLLEKPECGVVSYFFCRADHPQTRTVKAVLRGLLWLICTQSWAITRRLRVEYEHKMQSLTEFDDTVAFVNLEDMLGKALNAPSMSRAVIIVDAIDECDERSIRMILKTIGQLSQKHPAQWIMSTRTSEIYRSFLPIDAPTTYLELNKTVISKAVAAFVAYSVGTLSERNGYDHEIKRYVEETLCSKAGDTFLWVALVCLELGDLGSGTRHVKRILDEVPQGLTQLYERIHDKAMKSVDGVVCKEILRLVCFTYRPLALDELQTLVPSLEGMPSGDLRGVVSNCGSFFSLQGHENDLVIATFVHESAREYLIMTAENELSPDGITDQHQLVLHKSLSNMKALTRNIYQLPSLGTAIDEVSRPEPDPLSPLCYSGHHWLDHANHILQQGNWQASDNRVIEGFICHDLLHWSEMLSLSRNMAQGTADFQRFNKSYKANYMSESGQTAKLVEQAYRFLLYNKSFIERAPLQVYASALLFCPQQSMSEIKSRYQHELPDISIHPEREESTFSQLTQELPVSGPPHHISFAPDGNFLAATHGTELDGTFPQEHFLEVWDILASHRVLSVNVGSRIRGLDFSEDGTRVFAVLEDGTVNQFATKSGILMESIRYPSHVRNACFSPNKKVTALKVFEPESCQRSLVVLNSKTGKVVCSIANADNLSFAPDSSQMAVLLLTRSSLGIWSSRIDLWSTDDWSLSLTISLQDEVEDMTFFGSDKVAVRSIENIISILSTADGSRTVGFSSYPTSTSMTWLGSGLSYLCRCGDGTMRIYDHTGMDCVQSFPALPMLRLSIEEVSSTYTFSATSNFLAVAEEKGIRIWDLKMQEGSIPHNRLFTETWDYLRPVMTFSPSRNNSTLLAFTSRRAVGIRTIRHGKVVSIPTLPVKSLHSPFFSPNGKTIAYSLYNRRLQIWDIDNSTVSIERKFDTIFDLSFSHDSTSLAVAGGSEGVSLWDITTFEIKGIIPIYAEKVIYSHVGQLLAIVDSESVQVWSVAPVQDIHKLHSYKLVSGHRNWVFVDFSPDDQSLVIVVSEQGRVFTHNEHVLLWRLSESAPRCQLAWDAGPELIHKWKSSAISADGNLIAVALSHCVWVWDLRFPVTSQPLTIQLSYKTRKCYFDSESTRLLVDGGAITINLDLRQLRYYGYGLSDDRAWITKNNQKLLYLTQNFRPAYRAKATSFDSVAFMDSTVAIINQSGHIRILRFYDDVGIEDNRWKK